MLAGLKDQDLIKTEVFVMVQEMESLLGFNQDLGLCNFTQINRDLSNAKEAIDRGDYSSSQA